MLDYKGRTGAPSPSRIMEHGNKAIAAAAVALTLVMLWNVPMLPQPYPSSHKVVDPEQDGSTYLGGSPGFNVFSGLWYRNGTYYHFSDSPLPIQQEDAISGRTALRSLPLSDVPTAFDGVPIERFSGSSLIFNDGSDPWGPWTYFSWYYHFAAENMLGGMAALSAHSTRSLEARSWWEGVFGSSPSSSTGHPAADWLFVPWKDDWRDSYGMNEFLVKNLFPHSFVDKPNWDSIAGEEAGYPWLRFERAVLVDRVASGRDPLVDAATGWNKMAISALTQPHPLTFWDDTRRKLLASLRIKAKTTTRVPGRTVSGSRPKIIFVDRSGSNRHMVAQDREALVELLRRWDRDGRISFVLAKLEQFSHAQQIETVANADVLLSVHGNGLTHQLWMPPGGVVIELFTPDTFLRDYQVPAEALGHKHVAVRNDTILPREQWEHMRPAWEPLHDGTEISLHLPSMENLLRQVIEAMTARLL